MYVRQGNNTQPDMEFPNNHYNAPYPLVMGAPQFSDSNQLHNPNNSNMHSSQSHQMNNYNNGNNLEPMQHSAKQANYSNSNNNNNER